VSALHYPSGARSQEKRLTFSERLQEIARDSSGHSGSRTSPRSSNVFSYYGAFASLALYLQEKLNFSTEQTGTLTGLFGGMVWFLAIFGGAARPASFRRAFRSPTSSWPWRIF